MDQDRQKKTTRLAARGKTELMTASPTIDRRVAIAGMLSIGFSSAAIDASAQTTPTIFGYTDRESYVPGERIKLHLSAEGFSVFPLVVVWSLREPVNNVVRASGSITVNGAYNRVVSLDQSWPIAGEIQLPNNLPSGVYFITFSQGAWARIWIIVREVSNKRAEFLVVIPTFTVAAYNNFGGKSTYVFNSSGSVPATTVSLARPSFGAMHGNWYHNLNDLCKWLSLQYDCSFASETELHEDDSLLNGRRCVVFVGHNEYYTWQIRRNIQKYLGSGGSVANLGANTCWWLIEYDKATRSITTEKITEAEKKKWYWHRLGLSAKVQFGCAFEHGAFNYKTLPSLDAKIYNHLHWLYDGAGVFNEQTFGAALGRKNQQGISPGIAKYEVDGIAVEWVAAAAGGFIPKAASGKGYADSFKVLGIADLTNVDWEKPANASGTTYNWTIGFFHTQWGGRVFNAGTIEWGHAFEDSSGEVVDNPATHLTRNFLNSCRAGRVLYEHAAAYPRTGNALRYLYVNQPALRGEWMATDAALLLVRSSESGAVPLYRLAKQVTLPGTRVRLWLETLSIVNRAGWVVIGTVGHVFRFPENGARAVYMFTSERPGDVVVERFSVRRDPKPGETRHVDPAFYVY